jgi:hypothetical protein
MKRLATIFATIALVTLSSFASAGPSSADKDLAREVMKQGKAHEKAGTMDDALAAYRIADDILGDPTTRVALCRVLARVGKLVEAREACLSAIQMPKKTLEPVSFGKARGEATDLAVTLEERVPSLHITIKGLDAKVKPTITVDGTKVEPDTIEGPQPADPGKHQVEVTAAGYEAGKAEITLKEGQQATLDVVMKRTGSGDAEESSGGGFHPIFWVGIAATAVGLGAGIGTGIFVIGEKKRLDEECPQAPLCPPEYKDEHSTAVALAHVSTVSFVVAGLGVAMIVAGVFIPTDDDEQVGIWLRPGGFAFEGRF